jgi:hypothetical protein
MRRVLFLVLMIVIAAQSACSVAQQMDAQLNMAKRSLAQIETKLSNIQSDDVSQYNKVGEQLNKNAVRLKKPDLKHTLIMLKACKK